MSKPIRLLSFVVVAALMLGLVAFWLGRSRGQSTLVKYKAELRARGDKISFEELGYPRPPQTNQGLTQLVMAVGRLGNAKFEPGMLALMNYVGPGRAETCWSAMAPSFNSTGAAKMGEISWAEFDSAFKQAAPGLADIRAALEDPPRYFINNPSNLLNYPKIPFVEIRRAAQWLSGDTVRALHEHRLDETRENLHALTQLVHVDEDDPTLVSQMIRVAIAGLASADTWDALQADGWSAESLARLQKDWESVKLADGFEACIVGERAFGEGAFSFLRTADSGERMKLLRWSVGAGTVRLSSPKDYFQAYVVMPWWAANADLDEMFLLQHYEHTLDLIRKLHSGVPWPVVNAELSQHYLELNKAFDSPLGKFRYLLSAMAIPNSQKAVGVCVRNEMQRRLTVAAIALARHRLRDGKYPEALEALVPDFLPAVPTDLMSARPICYRLKPDGSFVLYSVGEDGRDDGGDAASAAAVGKFDLWSGRDAVWPVAAGKN